MNKSFFFSAMPVMMLVFGMTVVGCATTQHSVEIGNVPNIREIYIRNAGTTNWGTNMAGNLGNINKSIFSETVDIKVIDTNGIVYSKHNVPVDDAAFVVTEKKSSLNPAAGGVLGGLLGIGLLVVLLIL
jgi:hypothetical protein